MSITILYFASLREALGTEKESMPLPNAVATVGALRVWLIERGGKWTALSAGTVRFAVNQNLATADASVTDGDEVAFFPPVTGG